MSERSATQTMRANNPHTDDDEIITWWGLVIEGYHVTQQHVAAEVQSRFGLSIASFDILLRLVRSPQYRLPMTRLAREAAFSSGGFTKVADRLCASGFIAREHCPNDRRVTYLVLTDHGLDVAHRAKALCAEVLRDRVLAPLGDEASAQLAASMRTLRETNGPHA